MHVCVCLSLYIYIFIFTYIYIYRCMYVPIRLQDINAWKKMMSPAKPDGGWFTS